MVSRNLVKNPIKVTFGSSQYGYSVDPVGLAARAVADRMVRGARQDVQEVTAVDVRWLGWRAGHGGRTTCGTARGIAQDAGHALKRAGAVCMGREPRGPCGACTAYGKAVGLCGSLRRYVGGLCELVGLALPSLANRTVCLPTPFF